MVGFGLDEITNQTLRAVATQSHFDHWKRFEDDRLSFAYPDHPLVSLEIDPPREHVRVYGSPAKVGSPGRVDWVYRLGLGDATYGLVLTYATNAFDDSICLCGAVTYEKYLEHNGVLFRCSFLGDGAVKKIQALGEGIRIVMFESTHMPCTRMSTSRSAGALRPNGPSNTSPH